MSKVLVGNITGPQGVSGGTLATFIAPKVTPLIDAATITIDASDGNDFRVTLGGNRTFAAPTNPTDGQPMTVDLIQDSTGGRTVTWASGAGGFSFGSDAAPELTVTAGALDTASFRYNQPKNRWIFLGARTGN